MSSGNAISRTAKNSSTNKGQGNPESKPLRRFRIVTWRQQFAPYWLTVTVHCPVFPIVIRFWATSHFATFIIVWTVILRPSTLDRKFFVFHDLWSKRGTVKQNKEGGKHATGTSVQKREEDWLKKRPSPFAAPTSSARQNCPAAFAVSPSPSSPIVTEFIVAADRRNSNTWFIKQWNTVTTIFRQEDNKVAESRTYTVRPTEKPQGPVAQMATGSGGRQRCAVKC